MQLPSLIGKYELLEFLGGGMSHVYRARDTVIERAVVVKILTEDASADPESKARFLHEAKIAGGIQHENIVSVFDYGDHGGRPYIVMEYLEGETLKQVLDRGPVMLADVLDWGGQVAEALAAAHAHGVIHRDVKPDNLLLISDPRRPGKKQVKVLDFGIAKLQRLTMDQVHKTRTGALLGTPLYMSPEQCLSLKDIDARSDIYSLGVILYEMVTGKRPFDGDGLFVVISRHITEQPVPPTTYRADLPPQIEAVILKSLAKEPAQRQESMSEVLAQLALARGDCTGTSEVTGGSSEDRSTPIDQAKTFGRDQILAFLTEVDGMLHEPVVTEIVGGAAALLVHGASSETKDINSLSAFDERIVRAAARIIQSHWSFTQGIAAQGSVKWPKRTM
jgi:serine/threonine protein kinase